MVIDLVEGPDADLDVGPSQSLQVSAISAGTAAEAAESYTNVLPELLAEESMVVGHPALTQLGLGDLDHILNRVVKWIKRSPANAH